MTNDKPKNGFALIESVVGVLVASALMVSFVSLAIHSKKITRYNNASLKANLYLREMVEAAKDLEVSNWPELKISCGTVNPCHPSIVSGKWVILSGQESLDSGQFDRYVVVSQVCRNQLGFPNEIQPCDGVNPVDPNTKNVKATVKWTQGAEQREMNLEAMVFNL